MNNVPLHKEKLPISVFLHGVPENPNRDSRHSVIFLSLQYLLRVREDNVFSPIYLFLGIVGMK